MGDRAFRARLSFDRLNSKTRDLLRHPSMVV